MADEPTATPSSSASPTGFFSRPPQRPASPPALRPPSPPGPVSPVTDRGAIGAGAASTAVSDARPWTRYFARLVDTISAGLGLGVVLGLVAPGLLEINNLLIGMLVLVVWIAIETVLLSTWGTTPGKWLLGITLRTRQGAKLDAGAALRRSFNVWLKGLGLGIPIVCLITLVASHKRLTKQGETSWDAGLHQVRHAPLAVGRILILVAIIALFVVLSVIGAKT